MAEEQDRGRGRQGSFVPGAKGGEGSVGGGDARGGKGGQVLAGFKLVQGAVETGAEPRAVDDDDPVQLRHLTTTHGDGQESSL
jgi:hypothetical protein